MSKKVVIGAQWGDEGKGKIVDQEAASLGPGDLCVRFGGSSNAGHTLVVGGEKLVTHLLPSAIMHRGVLNLVGPAVACDLPVIVEELKIADRFGAEAYIDRSAPVVLPLHVQLDRLRESAAGAKKIGTTGRGVGPTFGSFYARNAVHMGDLTNPDKVRASLTERSYYEETAALIRTHGAEPMSLGETIEWCMGWAPTLRPRLADARMLVRAAERDGRSLLFEGAQGVMLDVIHGSQPHTTSSLCTLAGVTASFGVYKFDRVIGVAKAYTTRVGSGPFPTELTDEIGDRLRELGHEYGATTGRPRRCGWLDLPALLYACRMGGITELALTKADVLSGFPEVLIATGYAFEGRPIGDETLTSRVLREAEPTYRSFPGWELDSVAGAASRQDLPEPFRDFLSAVDAELRSSAGCPVTMIGTGSGREDIVHL